MRPSCPDVRELRIAPMNTNSALPRARSARVGADCRSPIHRLYEPEARAAPSLRRRSRRLLDTKAASPRNSDGSASHPNLGESAAMPIPIGENSINSWLKNVPREGVMPPPPASPARQRDKASKKNDFAVHDFAEPPLCLRASVRVHPHR